MAFTLSDSVRDVYGGFTADNLAKVERWFEHFEHHLNFDTQPTSLLLSSSAKFLLSHSPTYAVACDPSSEGEIADAIRKLRNKKVPGEDGISAEIGKSCVDTLVPWLHETWANIAGQPPKVSLSSGPSWCNNRLLPAPQVFPSNANRPLVNNQQQSELMQSVDSPKEEGTKRLGDPEAAASLRQNHPYPPVSSNGHASQGGKGRRGLPKAPDLSLGGAVLAASMRNGGGTLNRLGRDENSDEKTETDFSEKPAATVTQQAEAHYQLLAKQINPPSFNTNPAKARFFVIKSFSEDDIHRSIKYSIWCSTEMGNKKLNAAFAELNGTAPLYLFYSVNGSGRFCGMAEMTSQVDYSMRSSVWAQDKWQGQFSVKWIFVKDVPNVALRHIHIETNDNKPVTHSRDTTEVPLDRGRQVMEILAKYNHQTSIFDDFMYYEQREQQELSRKDSSSRRR
nr:unnamed protein product [Spirometra erinaceieuropaei]